MKAKILLGVLVAIILLAGSTVALANRSQNISEFSAVNSMLADKGIQGKDIQLSTTTHDENFVFQFYDQYYNNIPVYGGKVGFILKDGKVIYENNNYYKNININTAEPLVSLDEAEEIASEAATGDILSSQLLIFPKDRYYFLAYEIVYPEKTIFVDAEKGGILFEKSNIIYDDVYGNISGMIIPEKPADTKVSRQFKNEYINFTNGTVWVNTTTNNTGFYNASINGNVTANVSLEGPYVKVINAIQNATHLINVTSPTEHSWNWQINDTSADYEESNVFYHINYIHDYFTSGDPFNITAMNYQMQATVEYGSNWCNAQYNLGVGSIYFGNCTTYGNYATWSDIIYHEYTHGVIDHIYPLWSGCYNEAGAMHEGLADYFAATNNNNSCLTDNYYGAGTCMRDLNNTVKYHDRDGECHDDGRILSGALWDLRNLTNGTFTDALAMRGIQAQTQNFTAYLDAILALDDNDTNLSNGTPNIVNICHAFADNHGIISAYCAGHTQNPIAKITYPGNNSVFARNITISINGTAYNRTTANFTNYTLSYKLASDSTWTVLNTSNTSLKSGTLSTWNLSNTPKGAYDVKLETFDSSGSASETIRITATDAAIYCDSSPCIANSSLIMSRDSITRMSEPNSPNTIDGCLDGTGETSPAPPGGYMYDESLENITITASNETFQPGQNITVQLWGFCYKMSPYDYVKFVYSNSSNPAAMNWKIIGGTYCAVDYNFQNFSLTFPLDNIEGNHSFRGIMQLIALTGNISATCGSGAYDDADDVVFTVGAPLINITKPDNTTYTNQTNLPLNYTATDNVNVSACWYSIDSGNITVLTNCTNTTFNVSADGSHYARVYSNDTGGRTGSATRYFTVDTTAPIVTSTSPANSAQLSAGTTSTTIYAYTNEQAVCKYSTSDTSFASMTAFSSTNSTTHSFPVTGLSNGGSYDYYFRCQDLYSNTAASSYHLAFSVKTSDSGAGGGGDGGEEENITNITTPDLSSGEITYWLIVGDSNQFTLNGYTHTIKLDNITSDSATFELASNFVTFVLKVGGNKTFDINEDGIKDIIITLLSVDISSLEAKISIQKIVAPAAGASGTNETATVQKTGLGKLTLPSISTPEGIKNILVIVLILSTAIVAIILSVKCAKKRRKTRVNYFGKH